MKYKYFIMIMQFCLTAFFYWASVLASAHADDGRTRASWAIAEYLKAEPRIIEHYTHATGACTYDRYERLVSGKKFSPAEYERRAARKIGGFDDVPEELVKRNELTFAIEGRRLQSDVRQSVSKLVDKSGDIPQWKDVSAGPDAAPRFVFYKAPENSFRISWARRSNTPVLESYGDEGPLTRWVKEYPGDALYAPFGLFEKPFSAIIRSPEFIAKDVSDVVIGDHRCIRLLYEHEIGVKKDRLPKGMITKRSGIVTLSPEEGWVIRELAFSTWGKPPSYRIAIEYASTGGPYPPLSRVTLVGPELRSEYTFSRYQHGPAPSRLFEITTYGLPPLGKPDGGRSSTANPTPWLVGASMAFLAAAIGLGAYARRAKN